MATSDALQVIDLGLGDVEAGMALSSEAGWNQTGDDWHHFIGRGTAIGVRDGEGRLVASAAALPYEGPFGFIGMVLVTPDWRRQGIATRLIDRCAETLKVLELTPVLDATEAGEEVYRKQGFGPQFRFDRWERAGSDEDFAADLAKPEAQPDPNVITGLDARAFGARRPCLIEDFMEREGTEVLCTPDEDGFAMVRRGRRAYQAGPVVAPSERKALRLVEQIASSVKGAVFIDVLSNWRETGERLAARGFKVQRSFARMALGRAEPFGNPRHLFAVAGPEFG